MVGIVKTLVKHPVDRRRIYLNYDCWLEPTENLTSFQTVVSPNTPESPLALSLSYPDPEHRRLVMYAQGGVANTNYLIQLIVNTDEGQIKRDDIGMRIVP